MGCAVRCKICLIHIGHAGIHFRIHMKFFIRESTCMPISMRNKPHVDIHLHVLRPERIFRPISFCGITRNLNIGIKVKNTDRKLRQNCCSDLSIFSCTGNSDGSSVSLCIDCILRSKSFRKYHMIQFPMVHIIQINYGRHRLDRFNCCRFQIHPVNRTKEDPVKRSIIRNHIDSRGLGS